MAVRYLIIKHLSLGYGVLLKRENNDSGKIYWKREYDKNGYLSTATNYGENGLPRVIRTYFYDSSSWQDVLYSLGLAVYVEEVTAVGENADVEVAVYPNPASNQVNVKSEGLESITVIDLSGRIVRQYDVTGNSVSLDLTELGSGLYFLNVITSQGSSMQRLSVMGK